MWSLSVRMLVNHFLRWFQVACFSAVLFHITCARCVPRTRSMSLTVRRKMSVTKQKMQEFFLYKLKL